MSYYLSNIVCMAIEHVGPVRQSEAEFRTMMERLDREPWPDDVSWQALDYYSEQLKMATHFAQDLELQDLYGPNWY